MSNRASSFPADRAAARWYRERWPWLLIAGPAIVVVASLTSAWLAVATDDALVGGDYYKQGLMINRKLGSGPPAAAREPGAHIAVADDGRVRARLQYDGPAPQRVLLTLRHPGQPAQAVILAPATDGTWEGAIQVPTAGRWIVALESNLWRLPVTTVEGRIDDIRLGATAAP
jgi:hypothetical protein